MIPMIARVRLKQGNRFGLRLWIPLFLIWLLLAPLVLVLLPLLFVACAVARIHPFRAVAVLAGILGALAGTHIEVNDPNNQILIQLT